MEFDAMHLHPRILDNVKACGYNTPTPIQRQAIPVALEGRDIIGLAQTGTGKTAAFVIPILQRLMIGPRRQLRALVLAPTRELAEQTFGSFKELGRHLDIRATTVYGGVGMHPQIAAIRQGAEVVVACPGRLLDHMEHRTIRMDQIECLIIDEADRMFDMGFMPDVRRILSSLPRQRQTMLFSATMPDAIRRLIHDFLRDPTTIQIAHSRPAHSVSHAVYPVTPHRKLPLLLAILQQTDKDSVLIFTRTKHRARRLAEQLAQAGHPTTCLQGNLSQAQRKTALDGFRSGRFQMLVATDIAARGLDVSTISHVINFDMPNTVDDYTHRIGRTGRAAKTGDAFTLATYEDEGLIRSIEQILGSPIERKFLPGFDSGVRIHSALAPSADGSPAANPAGDAIRRFHRTHRPHRRTNRLRLPAHRR